MESRKSAPYLRFSLQVETNACLPTTVLSIASVPESSKRGLTLTPGTRSGAGAPTTPTSVSVASGLTSLGSVTFTLAKLDGAKSAVYDDLHFRLLKADCDKSCVVIDWQPLASLTLDQQGTASFALSTTGGHYTASDGSQVDVPIPGKYKVVVKATVNNGNAEAESVASLPAYLGAPPAVAAPTATSGSDGVEVSFSSTCKSRGKEASIRRVELLGTWCSHVLNPCSCSICNGL